MITEEQIRELAYAIWEQEGRLEGKDQEYYFRAKQMLEEQEAALSPAKESGPPASALQPPSPQKPIALEKITWAAHIDNKMVMQSNISVGQTENSWRLE